jgi:heptosyltransferase-2
MRIGLIRLTSLGDVTLTTGIVREVKLARETAELTVITMSRYEDIFRFNPHLEELLLLDGKSFDHMSGLIQKVRARKLDILADLQLNPRSLLISAASGAKKKLRYLKTRWVRSMMVRRKERKECGHVTSRYFRPFEQLGLRSANLKPQIWIDPATRESVDTLLPAGDTQMVAISPGARRATKRWPAEEYGELCRLLAKSGSAQIVIVGDREDTQIAAKVRNMVEADIVDLTGKTSLLQLASILERCSVLVTNDSGPMHIAVAMNTPTVAIFGPTVPEFGFSPLGERDRVIEREIECRPCSLHGNDRCRDNGFRCMSLIGAEEVFEVVTGALNGQ